MPLALLLIGLNSTTATDIPTGTTAEVTNSLIGLFLLFLGALIRLVYSHVKLREERNKSLAVKNELESVRAETQKTVNTLLLRLQDRNEVLSNRADDHQSKAIEANTKLNDLNLQIAQLQAQKTELEQTVKGLKDGIATFKVERDFAYKQSTDTRAITQRLELERKRALKAQADKIAMLEEQLAHRDTIINIYQNGGQPNETLKSALKSIDDIHRDLVINGGTPDPSSTG